MPVQDVYLLTLHEPYEAPEHPVPINATIVHARALLHPAVPQPDGGRMYRCLTEFPGRADGDLVPLSTLTFELNGGQLWHQVADWQAVSDAIVRLARDRHCDAMPLGLPHRHVVMLANGPTTTVTVYEVGHGRSVLTPQHRRQHLAEVSVYLRAALADGAFWPGDDLTEPPAQPAAMPWQPYGS